MTGIHRNFDHLDVLYASWTDSLQQFIGNLTTGLRLSAPNATTVRARSTDSQDGMSVGIQGRWRYSSANVDRTVSGSAGVKDVFIVAVTDNDFVGAGDDPDETNYAFELRVVTTATTPAGVAAYRKIGEVDWDGNVITGIRQLTGAGDTTAPVTPTAPRPEIVPVIAKGAASQTANLFEARDNSGNLKASIDKDGNLDLAGTIDADNLASALAATLIPAGTVQLTATAAAPSGWLLCQGQSLLRADYPDLFSAIGTAFGSVDGTHFTLPDLRDRVPVGISGTKTRGATGGAATVTLTGQQSGIKAHSHGVAITTGTESADHTHGFLGLTNPETTPHTHPLTGQGTAYEGGTPDATAATASGGAHTHQYGGDAAGNTNTSSGTGQRITSLADGVGGEVDRVTTSTGAHTHSLSGNTGGPNSTHQHPFGGNTAGKSATHTHDVSGTTQTTGDTSASQAHENLPPYQALNYMIKT